MIDHAVIKCQICCTVSTSLWFLHTHFLIVQQHLVLQVTAFSLEVRSTFDVGVYFLMPNLD